MNTGSIVFFFKSTFKGMYKNALMTLASVFVLVACMLMIGSVLFVSENVLSFLNKLEAQNEIVAFIDDEYDDDTLSRKEICDKIEAIDGVTEVIYVTKEQALSEYRASLGEHGEYLEGYSGNDNPLRNELRIKIADISMFSDISNQISEMDEIANTRDSQSVVDMLLSVRRVLNILCIWILLVLSIVSLFIISNTIKLTMYARRHEINIMKYVGATNRFIRFPFVLQGIIIGLISMAIALVIQWSIYTYAVIPLISQLSFFSDAVVPFSEIFAELAIIFAAIGLAVGIFGSALSIRKYLKV